MEKRPHDYSLGSKLTLSGKSESETLWHFPETSKKLGPSATKNARVTQRGKQYHSRTWIGDMSSRDPSSDPPQNVNYPYSLEMLPVPPSHSRILYLFKPSSAVFSYTVLILSSPLHLNLFLGSRPGAELIRCCTCSRSKTYLLNRHC